jgi:hypothetical protein
MSDKDNCCDAEYVASWRKFMAKHDDWQTHHTPNVFAQGFREGMKYAQEQATRLRENSPSALDDLHLRTGGPIRTRLGEIKGPPINEVPDNRRMWYVHVNECGGVWGLVGGGPMTRAEAETLAVEVGGNTGKRVYIGTDWEKRGL